MTRTHTWRQRGCIAASKEFTGPAKKGIGISIAAHVGHGHMLYGALAHGLLAKLVAAAAGAAAAAATANNSCRLTGTRAGTGLGLDGDDLQWICHSKVAWNSPMIAT